MIGRSPEFFVAYPPDQLSTRNAIGPLRGPSAPRSMKGIFSSGRSIRSTLGTQCLDLCEEHNDLDCAARHRVDPDCAVLHVDVLRHSGRTVTSWPSGPS